MRFERRSPRSIMVILSRRNLLSLLSKLSIGDSAKTIMVETDEGSLFIQVEDDEEHYSTRGFEPGPMHSTAEAFIKEFTASVTDYD